MSKIITFKGKVNMGTQERLKLSTIKGKIGYRINKFQIISTTPGVSAHQEIVAKIFTKSQSGSISALIDFSESDLLAAVFYQDRIETAGPSSKDIILDQEIFNQDIFITMQDVGGATIPYNYYIELEAMAIDDVESTMLTLKSIKTIIGQ